jgi:hypothetical protein
MRRVALLLAIGGLVSGCWMPLANSVDVALYQSDLQHLVVTNTTTKALTIQPRPSGAPVQLAPGQSLSIPFRVATIGTAVPPAGSALGPGGYTEHFEETQSATLVDASSTALALNFHDAQGVLVKASFELTGCGAGPGWAQQHVPTADHPLQLPDPIPAIPQAVCP